MKPSEIRAELMAEHARLRTKIAEVRRVAELWQEGKEGDLRTPLVALTDAIHMHNAREEDLMANLLPSVDAWGPARAEVMREEHGLEHGALFTSLVVARDASATSPSYVLDLLERLLSHMAREEEAFLGVDVLSDEEHEPDHFGG
jgi:hypothetical protein